MITTNKIFKIVVVMMVLLTTIFSFGCSSENKQEKFVKLESQLEKSKEKGIKDLTELNNNKKLGDVETVKKVLAIMENHLKEVKPIVEEMDKLSKGDKSLEEAMKEHWTYYRNGLKTKEQLLKELKSIEK